MYCEYVKTTNIQNNVNNTQVSTLEICFDGKNGANKPRFSYCSAEKYYTKRLIIDKMLHLVSARI